VSLPLAWRLFGFDGAYLELCRPFELDEIV